MTDARRITMIIQPIGLNNLPGLNGDLLLWDDVLQRSIELSSMGIRVDKELYNDN